MENTSLKNHAAVCLLTVGLGAAVGLVLWLFLQVVSLGTSLIWTILPAHLGGRWVTIPLCVLGGILAGLVHRRFGDYPESLDTVMGKVKRDRHYDYRPMPVILVCALLPLIFGASVGPEAGLTGIIAGLCYWVGDNVNFARQNAALYTEIGEAVTLGQIFHMPLFGILAVEEEPDAEGNTAVLPKAGKLVLYALSAAACFLVIAGLNALFHTSIEGFPSFSEVTIAPIDYLLVLLYIPVGLLLYYGFTAAEFFTEFAAVRWPVVWREGICGLLISLVGLSVPMVLFSGEEQMGELMLDFGRYTPWLLIGICLLKLVMTAFCLNFGMKGGHFFPLIFGAVCFGYGISLLIFPGDAAHATFAAAIVTASTLGVSMKKPLAVSMLLLLCFPLKALLWIIPSAALSAYLGKMIAKKKNGGETC